MEQAGSNPGYSTDMVEFLGKRCLDGKPSAVQADRFFANAAMVRGRAAKRRDGGSNPIQGLGYWSRTKRGLVPELGPDRLLDR